MRTIRYYVATSLDGFIAREDGRFDYFVDDPALTADMFAHLERDYDAVIMGRATYEVGLAAGVTDPYPWLETHVVSRTLDVPDAPNVRVHRGLDSIEALRATDGGDIWLCGGGDLAGQLLARGWIDELTLKANPVVAGRGIRLFGHLERPRRLRVLAPPKRYESGIAVTRYAIDPS